MQRELASEQELNFKKRARRRLVGAIALVVLMIIVLPMILKDRNAANTQEKITITLPSEQAQSEPSDFDSSVAPDETNIALPEADSAAKDEVTVPESSPVNAPSESVNVKSESAAPIKETAENAADKTADTAKHKFYVQIGVFSDAGNVKQLQAKLSDLGYKSQTEKIVTDKGQKIRLRTQVFGDRNDAAIALQNIKDSGLTGMVVSQ